MHKCKTVQELYEVIKSSKNDYGDIERIIKDDLSQKEGADQLGQVNNIRYKVMTEIAGIDELLCVVTGAIIPVSVLVLPIMLSFFSNMTFLIVLLIVFIIGYIKVLYYYCGKKKICVKLAFSLDKIREELNQRYTIKR